MPENREALPDQEARLRWTIKPETLVADNGAEITMGLAYGPALEVETVVCSVEEMILERGKAAPLRRRLWECHAAASDGVPVPFERWLADEGVDHMPTEIKELREAYDTAGDALLDAETECDRLRAENEALANAKPDLGAAHAQVTTELQEAVRLLDALSPFAGHDVGCVIAYGGPECMCGFDDLYTQVRALVRETPLASDEDGAS